MRARFFPPRLPVLLAGMLLAAGCGHDGGPLLTSETSDSNYIRGKELLREGRDQDALAAFLKVIATRGDDNAPESHLEAGLLYEDKIKNQIEAVHHYQKYRELEPGSPQAGLVRERIDAALREFGRTLPGQPLDQQSGELLATVERLQAENLQLRNQLAATSGGRLPPHPAAPAVISPAPAPNDPPIRPAPPPPATAAAATGRKHTIAAGDTLSKIAQQYYGDRSKYHQIFEANRDVMKDENRLPPIGTVLKIP